MNNLIAGLGLIILTSLIINEIITFTFIGFHAVHGKGYGYIKTELQDYTMSTTNVFIRLNKKSPLKGDNIFKTSSFLIPYRIEDVNSFKYGIYIFSDEYYLVDSVFKANSPIEKERVRF